MTTIYYLSTILIIWLELTWLMSPIEKTNDAKKFFELSKQFKGKKWDEFSEEYKSEMRGKFLHIFVLIWLFFGLFTFQWAGFLAILVFNFLIIGPISKITRFSIAYTIIHFCNSIIGFAFGLFIIINHYHLHIDLTQLLLSFLK